MSLLVCLRSPVRRVVLEGGINLIHCFDSSLFLPPLCMFQLKRHLLCKRAKSNTSAGILLIGESARQGEVSQLDQRMAIINSYSEAWTFLTSIVMGITMVMGVSAVTSAPSYMTDYYKYVANDPNAKPGNAKFWRTVLTFYLVVTMVTQTVFEPVNLTTFCCRLSLKFRLYASCVLMLLELLVLLLIPVSSSTSENAAIAALMIMAFVGGFARAFYENTGYALFGPFPSIMIGAFVIGAAVSGLVMSVLQITIKASMADDYYSVRKQAFIYFSIAIGIIVVTMIMLWSLSKNSFSRRHVAELRSKRGFFANIYRKRKEAPEPTTGSVEVLEEEAKQDEGDASASPAESVEGPTTAELLQTVKLWPIIKKIYPMQFSCFYAYFLSFLLFPGVMLAMDEEDPWYGTIVVAVFNAADLVGRLLCLIKACWVPRRWVVIGALVRTLLVPILVLCAKRYIPTFAAAYTVSGVLGMTNGYLATISVSYTPDTEGLNSDGERALAGQATGVCLLFGVSTGSLLQLAIVLAL
ncbi:nucleoside transporter [Trypanosoma conorhini]|uniref:Nucleoside transporter n=1 Tax=Trypanosoma conorhini TaxID=83891 RepID=A0A422NWP2_9TRYP|nr:nucleoside transporter [Trypanosoma conorhini]RNF09943.1 nucleoside transporter [Trypanosoma conorhini]